MAYGIPRGSGKWHVEGLQLEKSMKAENYREYRIDGKVILSILAEKYGIPTDHVTLHITGDKRGVYVILRMKAGETTEGDFEDEPDEY